MGTGRVEMMKRLGCMSGMAGAASLCCLFALLPSCGEPIACSADMRFPVTGDVYDKDGNAIVPDRVTVAYPRSVVHECEIEPPSKGAARFRCVEGYDTGLLTAYYGAESVSRHFEVREDEDGCHALPQEIDLKFE